MGAGQFCGFDDLLVPRVLAAVSDIFANWAGEEMWCLQDDANAGLDRV